MCQMIETKGIPTVAGDAEVSFGALRERAYPSGVLAEPGSRFTKLPCLTFPTYF